MTHLKSLIENIVLRELGRLDTQENKITVYFDMDGVLADFDGMVEQLVGNSQQKIHFDKMLDLKPELKKYLPDELRATFKGKQEDPVMAKIKKSWNKYRNLTYNVASEPGFFLNLRVLPGAKSMLIKAHKITGNLPDILTAPIETSSGCKKEKYKWVQKNINGLYNKFYCTQEKQVFAHSKYDILIDDRPKYIDRFISAGGTGILHDNPEKSMRELKEFVEDAF